MRSAFSLLLIFFLSSKLFSQSNNFQLILDSGKTEFKNQFSQYYPDYSKALNLLKQAVSTEPGNAEARYFYGYVLDKMNTLNGLDSVDLKLTFDVSEQLEAINKLQQHYSGEYMVLDPYSKLTANWGSLGFRYLTESKKDSAIWALTEGKKRGGFSDGILEYNRQVLSGCEKNAVLVVSGDNITFPCTYLQLVERFRTDVTLVDGNLLNADWYRKLLKTQQILNTDYGIEIPDTSEYLVWKTDTVKIADLKGRKKSLVWELKPTYEGVLLTGNLSLLGIIKRNFFEKPIYFLADSDSASHLFLDNHLIHDGFLLKLTSDNVTENSDYRRLNNLEKYSILPLNKEEINKSQDVMMSFNGLRLVNLTTVYVFLNRKQKKEAKELFADMEKRFPIDRLPFFSKEMEEYYFSIKSLVDQ